MNRGKKRKNKGKVKKNMLFGCHIFPVCGDQIEQLVHVSCVFRMVSSVLRVLMYFFFSLFLSCSYLFFPPPFPSFFPFFCLRPAGVGMRVRSCLRNACVIVFLLLSVIFVHPSLGGGSSDGNRVVSEVLHTEYKYCTLFFCFLSFAGSVKKGELKSSLHHRRYFVSDRKFLFSFLCCAKTNTRFTFNFVFLFFSRPL